MVCAEPRGLQLEVGAWGVIWDTAGLVEVRVERGQSGRVLADCEGGMVDRSGVCRAGG